MSDIYAENHHKDPPDYCLECGAPSGTHNAGCSVSVRRRNFEIDTLRAENERLREWQRARLETDDLARAEMDRLRAALKPFAEAARLASIGGRPPWEFVDASAYERAEALLQQRPPEK